MTRKKQISKPGKHGTLKLWRVHYEDTRMPDDPMPPFASVTRMWAYDSEHVELRFTEGPDADGWRITKIEPVYTT